KNGFLRILFQRQNGAETRSGTRFAFDGNAAVHEADEFFANRESEAGAAVFSGGGTVALHERFKEPFLGFAGNADAGVAHVDADGRGFRSFLEEGKRNGNFAGFGEFDRVSDEI